MDSSGAAEPSPCKEAVKVHSEVVDVRGYSRDTEAQDMSMAGYGFREGSAVFPAMCIM